ncbi:E3 ubiquitin-protein ligase MARCHF9 isoform X1 [Oryzias melastigma]|uniref:E3 ubiquitin-protein ligase MARCHF9 isoform X1 n=1 Tax=Oryzias melastigma TaxID=30732 RepID=UPI00168D683F|nr:E3 ubiquitin-protein ligase MARCHF9 isoform X1 [Oryzias melastigma]
MFKFQIRMFFSDFKVLLLMSSEPSRTDTGTDTQSRMRGLAFGSCGWPQISCSRLDEEEEDEGNYGLDPQPNSVSFEDAEGAKQLEGGLDGASLLSVSEIGVRTPQCRICFQGPEKGGRISRIQGEMLSPCRCDGSVRWSHHTCLIRWISERGSWSCELCHFKYQVLAINTRNPLQWQPIPLTVIEKVQIAAIVLGSLFLCASVSWLVWSSLSPSARWQRQDLLFQICYGMYGFMDIVCVGLIIHEGSSVYRIFKRWRAVNQKWKVLNYEKAKDLADATGSSPEAAARLERNSSSVGRDSGQRASRHVRTILSRYCGYTVFHILRHLRPNNLNTSNQEVVMRVTTV